MICCLQCVFNISVSQAFLKFLFQLLFSFKKIILVSQRVIKFKKGDTNYKKGNKNHLLWALNC